MFSWSILRFLAELGRAERVSRGADTDDVSSTPLGSSYTGIPTPDIVVRGRRGVLSQNGPSRVWDGNHCNIHVASAIARRSPRLRVLEAVLGHNSCRSVRLDAPADS